MRKQLRYLSCNFLNLRNNLIQCLIQCFKIMGFRNGFPSYPRQMEYELCGDLCTMAVKQERSELPGDQMCGSQMRSELCSRTSGHRALQNTSMFANCSLPPDLFKQIFFFFKESTEAIYIFKRERAIWLSYPLQDQITLVPLWKFWSQKDNQI